MARTQIRGITEEQFQTLKLCMQDIFTFATFVFLVHPIRGRLQFDLFDYQRRVLWYFLTQRFNIVLKFRQAGLTELIALYCLWFAMYHPNKNIQIISIKDQVAKRVLKRIKFMYKNLPYYLQVTIVNGKPTEFGTVTDMEFANGSIITSVPTTEQAGRSEALSLLVIDEAAIVKWADQIWASAFPTLSTGGAAIINSTPYGIGNFYHKTWSDALLGVNDFNPIRLRWPMHPERDESWYLQMRTALGPRRTAQEIDGDFLSSGNTVFDLADIKSIEEDLIDYQPLYTRYNGNLIVYENPKPGEYYCLGADLATGRSRDFSAFSIMTRHGREVACFKGKMPTNIFRDLLLKLGKQYNTALLALEANSLGEGVVANLQESGYNNLYYTTQILKEKGTNRPKKRKVPGWYTTTGNRSIIVDTLEEDLRLNNISIKDPFFVSEAYTFIYDDRNTPIALGKEKRRGAQDDILSDEGYTDDAIIAKAITNYVRKGLKNQVIIAPK